MHRLCVVYRTLYIQMLEYVSHVSHMYLMFGSSILKFNIDWIECVQRYLTVQDVHNGKTCRIGIKLIVYRNIIAETKPDLILINIFKG